MPEGLAHGTAETDPALLAAEQAELTLAGVDSEDVSVGSLVMR